MSDAFDASDDDFVAYSLYVQIADIARYVAWSLSDASVLLSASEFGVKNNTYYPVSP